jgi:hypothetical protein
MIEELACGSTHVHYRGFQFVPGNGSLSVEVQATRMKAPIRRITDHEVEATRSQSHRELPKISLLNLNPLTKAIDLDVVSCQVHKFRLYFQAQDPLPEVPISKNQRDYATAGPQIQDAIIGVHSRETRKQNSVNCETVPPFLLTNQQLSVEERIARQ